MLHIKTRMKKISLAAIRQKKDKYWEEFCNTAQIALQETNNATVLSGNG